MNMTTYWKRKAIALLDKHDIDYDADARAFWETDPFTGERYKVRYIDLDAPQGYRFEPELHMLVCYSWKDAYHRVLGYLHDEHRLEKCDSDCGDHYECWKGE
tara:strand:- start:477 stop:782 length:306 start_codon:yes stop_codon:yes gene_type:complete